MSIALAGEIRLSYTDRQTPIKKGDKVGLLNIYVSNEFQKKIEIFAAEDVKRSNIFSRLFTSLNYLVWGDV